jgi:hypothetical protein
LQVSRKNYEFRLIFLKSIRETAGTYVPTPPVAGVSSAGKIEKMPYLYHTIAGNRQDINHTFAMCLLANGKTKPYLYHTIAGF